ncbi:hypothetical protein IGI42_002490 [Enterococcus sp. AZ109]
MNYLEFKEFLESTNAYEIYMQKALVLQHDRNSRRSEKKGKNGMTHVWKELQMKCGIKSRLQLMNRSRVLG